jgi:glucose/arabinose dehydrogenase
MSRTKTFDLAMLQHLTNLLFMRITEYNIYDKHCLISSEGLKMKTNTYHHAILSIALILFALSTFALGYISLSNPPEMVYAQAHDPLPEISLIQVAEGLARPVNISHAGDGSGRLFIIEQLGRIRILDGSLYTVPFLDIETRVQSPESGGGNEEGLLGLAFPPDYTTAGYFYVYYTNNDGDNVLSRFYLSADPDLADPDSEEQILLIPHPTHSNHNGGQLAFGPDGMLYIGVGDGGGGGDPLGNAQDKLSLKGKLLRIDVGTTAAAARDTSLRDSSNYAIPADNPFVDNSDYLPEIWALGLRNPWRFSFDRLTGDLYIADVGQSSLEEINFQAADSNGGENYGWNIMEGDGCYNAETCSTTGLTLPVHVYSNVTPECAVTGGFVYRGTDNPYLQGVYLFGDFCSGKIWGLQQNGDSWDNQLLINTELRISSFGEDEEGNLYVADMVGGSIYRLSMVPPTYLPLILK